MTGTLFLLLVFLYTESQTYFVLSLVSNLETVHLVALLDVVHLSVRTPLQPGPAKPLGASAWRSAWRFGGHTTSPAWDRPPLCGAPNTTKETAAQTIAHAEGNQNGDRHCRNGLERMCIDHPSGFWWPRGRNMVPNLVRQDSYVTVDALHRCRG